MATGPSSDKRFSSVGTDPRFWEIPDSERRVKIDPRFASMFTEDRFNSSSALDKRGRLVNYSQSDELRRLYRVEAEPDDESDDDLESDSADPARGKGNVETSSEDEYDEVEEILRKEEEEIEHRWGEMSRDAPRSEQVSARLAVCNMDWDRLKAKDLLLILRSFIPDGGAVLSVKIFPSEFGKQRLKEEELRGPIEIRSLPEESEEDTEEDSVYRERLRDYQFKRLQYFYAVVECDSAQTAVHIYQECDGYEYESSCSTLDLRFIPDDVTFEDAELKDQATDVNASAFEPKLFTSSAAGSSKVQLSWDETDHERVSALNRKFNKEQLLQMDFSAYLASSSEEEVELSAQEEEDVIKRSSDAQISRYRNLLTDLKLKEQQQEHHHHMEVRWKPGLKQSTHQLVKKKLEVKEPLTPWQTFLLKKKQKKKKKMVKHGGDDDDDSDDDDDIIPPDVDLTDPFFSELRTAGPKKKPQKKNLEKPTAEEVMEEQRQKAQVSLLLDDDNKQNHFNYERIVEQQNLSKKKRKRQMKNGETFEDDHFQLDVGDLRFDALYSSPLFNIDPSHPSYRNTSANHSITAEKQRRRFKQAPPISEEGPATSQLAPPPQDGQGMKLDPQLQLLVKSVKNKTMQFEAQKRKKI